MGEFDLIRRCFARDGYAQAGHRATGGAAGVALGIGDDCALLAPTPGMQLAVSSDMLVEGRHFLSTVDPVLLGHKALAVNLSDLAACGATPLGCTLALALPTADVAWTEALARGLFALADAHACPLVGGDTTRGPLNLCITVFGQVPRGQALLRSGAQPGDEIWVSGTLGDAWLALQVFRGQLSLPADLFTACRRRMEAPTPRVALGQALRGLASAAIDISDGLLGDLGHIARASGVHLRVDSTIATTLLAANAHPYCRNGQIDSEICRQAVLAGGDDYELAFTAPAARHAEVLAVAAACATPVTCIGTVLAPAGASQAGQVQVHDAQGRPLAANWRSFDHFA